MKNYLVVACILIYCFGYGQDSTRYSGLKVNPIVGVNWQGAITSNLIDFSKIVRANLPSYCGGAPCMPYNYERNLQGLGLVGGLNFNLKWIDLYYHSVFRYDEIYFEFHGNDRISNKEIIFHHRIGLNIYISMKSKNTHYVGLSYMVLNTNKKFRFYDSFRKIEDTFNLEFPSYIFSYGRSLLYKKLFGELQLYYLFKGMPHNISQPYFMYGLSFYYKIK